MTAVDLQKMTRAHTFDKVDFSNTNHAAITAGSRPADPNGPSCGTSTQDCDIGEFTMNDVTFTMLNQHLVTVVGKEHK